MADRNEPAPKLNLPKLPGSDGGGPEGGMEWRLLGAFGLMAVILFLTPNLLKTTKQAPPAKKATPVEIVKKDAPKDTKSAAVKPTDPAKPAPPLGQIAATSQDDNIVLETDLYRVRFSNRGGVVQSWQLKRYKDSNRRDVELVNPAGAYRVGHPFSIFGRHGQLEPDPNAQLFVAKRTPEGIGVDFEFSDGKLYVKKSFRFEKSLYRANVTTEVQQEGKPATHYFYWRGGFGDFTFANPLPAQHSLFYDNTANKLEIKDSSTGKDTPVQAGGSYRFAGLEDTYFAAVVLPRGASMDMQIYSDKVPYTEPGKDPTKDAKEEQHVGVALGGDTVNNTSLYVGPKDIDILKAVDPRLEQVVDFGWLAFIVRPLLWALNAMNDRYIHNYGWTIVIVTLIINVLLMPLKIANMASMKKTSALQPQLKAIQAKYQSLPMRDPKRGQQQEETMELYRKHGVNPFGGCVPMLLQLPFFFAFYKVLSVAIEMRGASWLWVSDLSQPETLAIRILPIATIATQFVMQRMTPTAGMDPQQQKIMQLMPLMFIFVFYNVSSGLVLYWLTGNLIGMVQQWFFNRTILAPAPAAAPVTVPKKSPKK